MKNLNKILEELIEEKRLSHTSDFRKKALMSLNEQNPYDLYKKLYKNKDVENAKLLFTLFPNIFYDGEFRKDVVKDRHAKKENDVQFLNKSFITFMKDTGVLENKNELNHILVQNKAISRNSRGTSSISFIKPFVNLSLNFNVNFTIMCMKVNEATLPPVYNRMILSDMAFNSLRGKEWEDFQNCLIDEKNIMNDAYSSKFKNRYENSNKNYHNIDNIAFILENQKLSSYFKEKVKELLLSENIELYNNYFKTSHASLKSRINAVVNLLESGMPSEQVFDIVKLVKVSEYTEIEEIKKIIDLGFDINSKITDENKSEYHFWFEKMLNHLHSEVNAMVIMKYAVENGLDLLSPIDESNPKISIVEYVVNKSDNVHYKNRNEKEVHDLLNYAKQYKANQEKLIIENNLKEELSPLPEIIKKRI